MKEKCMLRVKKGQTLGPHSFFLIPIFIKLEGGKHLTVCRLRNRGASGSYVANCVTGRRSTQNPDPTSHFFIRGHPNLINVEILKMFGYINWTRFESCPQSTPCPVERSS